MEENKKYIVLVTQYPYGYNTGMGTKPAKSLVLNNKIYDALEEAEIDKSKLEQEVLHSAIESRMHLDYDMFYELRAFIINNGYIHGINGVNVKNTFSKQRMIDLFIEMYNLQAGVKYYDEKMFDEDEKLYQKLMYDEPKIEIVEVNV